MEAITRKKKKGKNTWSKTQQLEFLLEPGSKTILARFGQHCTGSLLNIVSDQQYFKMYTKHYSKWFSSPVLERALSTL